MIRLAGPKKPSMRKPTKKKALTSANLMRSFNQAADGPSLTHIDPYEDDDGQITEREEPSEAQKEMIMEGIYKLQVPRKEIEGNRVVAKHTSGKKVVAPNPEIAEEIVNALPTQTLIMEPEEENEESDPIMRRLNAMRREKGVNNRRQETRSSSSKSLEDIIGISLRGSIVPTIAFSLLRHVGFVRWVWMAYEPILHAEFPNRVTMTILDQFLKLESLGCKLHNFTVMRSENDFHRFFFEMKFTNMNDEEMQEMLAKNEDLSSIEQSKLHSTASDFLRVYATFQAVETFKLSDSKPKPSDPAISETRCRLLTFWFAWVTSNVLV